MEISKGLKKGKGQSKTKTAHICEYCNKEFSYRSVLVQHQRIHTGQKPFVCKLCGHATSKKDHLEIHLRAHLQEKPFKCPEEGCNYSACLKGTVTTHHNVVHLQQKRFQCRISSCSFKTGRRSHLSYHMTTHEENPAKPFHCHLCPYKAKVKSTLKSHLNQVHSQERKFPCPHSTEGCNYKAKARGALSNHIKTHGEKTLSCHFSNSGSGCEYKTSWKLCLKRHMLIHSQKPQSEKKFKCRICHFSSHHSEALVVHIRTHTKETPYKCRVEGCSFQAKQAGLITLHVRAVHEKRRPFKCPLCPYSAAQKGALKDHVKRKHPDPDSDSDMTESNSP